MAKQKFNYGWIVKWVLAALLLAVGIISKVFEERIVYATTGVAVVIFSIFRIVPLFKSLNKEGLRTINLVEVIFDVIIGGLMVYVGFFAGDPIPNVWVSLYGYILAFFMLMRGIVYFVSLYYFGEKTEQAKFWTHILFLVLGTVVATITVVGINGNDIISLLGWFLLIFAIGGAVYLTFDGYGGYKKYREKSKALNDKKRKETKPDVEKELPRPIEDEVEEKETYIS